MTSSAGALTPAPVRPRFDARSLVRGIGELLITLGVIVFLFVAYELWFTGVYTAQQQSDLKHQLQREWATAAPAAPSASSGATPGALPAASGAPAASGVDVSKPVPGGAIGIIRIPRLGASYAYAIVEGVSTDDLKKGPGHFPGTAMPGQVGNLVISGHRTTYLAPFNGLGDLTTGDAIVIETADTWFTYRVTSTEVVLPTDVAVVLPVANKPGVAATEATITLTTCTPKYSASHRLVVHGLLESALPKSGGLPPALQGVH